MIIAEAANLEICKLLYTLQIIWVSLLTFINEILLGPQGILNLLQRSAAL